MPPHGQESLTLLLVELHSLPLCTLNAIADANGQAPGGPANQRQSIPVCAKQATGTTKERSHFNLRGIARYSLSGASLGCNSWLAKAAQGGYRGTGHEAGSVWWAPTAKGSSSATSACWGTEPFGPLDGAGESTLRGFVEGESEACSSESSNDATEVYESGNSDCACRAPNHAILASLGPRCQHGDISTAAHSLLY